MDGMKARQFVAIVALHAPPAGPLVTPGECEEALSDALRGVVLGGYDEMVCAWMVRSFNLTTLRVTVSLIERVRAAGMEDAARLQEHMERQRNTGRIYYGQHPR
jgi:hypothetical protein